MKQEFYDRLAAPFEASERKKNCLLRVNHILTDVVYLIYPALLLYLVVCRDSRFWRVLLVPAVTFVLVSLFRKKFNAPRPYENWQVKPLIPKDTKGNSFPSRHVFSIYIIAMAAWYVWMPLGVILCVAGGFLGSSAGERTGAFCKRCGGRCADRCRIWSFMFLGDLKTISDGR